MLQSARKQGVTTSSRLLMTRYLLKTLVDYKDQKPWNRFSHHDHAELGHQLKFFSEKRKWNDSELLAFLELDVMKDEK